MSDTRPTGATRWVFGLLKTLCILTGLPMTVIALMSLVGLVTANFWARLIVGLVVAIALPLVIVDRLLPDDDQHQARGLTTDLLALVWILFPLIFFSLAQGVTQKTTALEADRLAKAGHARIAAATYWLASVRPVATPLPATKPVPTTKPVAAKPAPTTKPVAAKPAPTTKPIAAKPAPTTKPVAAQTTTQKTKTYAPAEIFARYAPAVVSIRTARGSGTGFIIDTRGTIATNRHVIAGASKAQIKLKDGTWIREVELLAVNKKSAADLALLRITLPKAITPVVLGDASKVKVGEHVIAIGNPLGLEHTLTDGLVSQRRRLRGKRWIQMSTPISPGNSGGPVFNMRGEVIGISTATIGGVFAHAQNLNLAVPIDELKKMIKTTYPKRKPFGSAVSQTW